MKPFLSLVLFLVLMGTGCSNTGGSASERSGPAPGDSSSMELSLAGPLWQLKSFGTAAKGGAQPALGDPDVTATFSDEDGRVAGSGGCNRYRASFEHRKSALTISRIGSTKKMCAPPIIDQEQRFFATLRAAQMWTRAEGDRLTLLDGDGKRLLHFTAQDTTRSQ